jgi:hypothetical protein
MGSETQITTIKIIKAALKATAEPRMSKKERDKIMAAMSKHLNEMIERQAFDVWGFACTTPKAEPKDWDAAPRGFVSMWPS